MKIGGAPARDVDSLLALAAEIRDVRGGTGARPARIALVHGGGAEVSELSRRLGLEPIFQDGVRVTSEAEMDVVDMVLCGLVNTRIVRRLCALGLPAVGVSGTDDRLLSGEPIVMAAGTVSRTARAEAVNPNLLVRLWDAGYLPVVASPGSDSAGNPVNINADEAALALGRAVSAHTIVFISDVAGITGRDGTPLRQVTPGEADTLIRDGVIHGGMTAKVRSAVEALAAGVSHIVIGSFSRSGDLLNLVNGRTGTTITGGPLS